MPGYKKLKPDATGADICPVHHLLNLPKVAALLDAEALRSGAIPGTPTSMAVARHCPEGTGDWHIFIPTRGRARTLRKKMRAAGLLPPAE